MFDGSNDEKTEQATPKRLEKARAQGQVVHSRDLDSATVFIVGLISLLFICGPGLKSWKGLFSGICNSFKLLEFPEEAISISFSLMTKTMMAFLIPFFGLMILTVLISSWGQTRFMFSIESLIPKFSRLDPISGLSRIFSTQGLMELCKAIFKFTGVGFVGYTILVMTLDDAARIIQLRANDLPSYIFELTWKITFRCSLFIGSIALIDYLFQRKQWSSQMKMTRREIKDEMKETEGNPQIKSRVKAMMKKIAGRRMMKKVPEAQVIITNPTHFAIALQYTPKMKAPKVIAKGADKIAEKIKEIARQHNIPMVENKYLARLLYKWVEPGEDVPSSMYQAVAEVLAYVFRLKTNPGIKNRV